jgi:molecular chaperone Hsp33
VQIEGNGPLRKLQAETDAHGFLRATIKNPLSGLPPKGDAFDVAGAIGHAGFLHVVKDLGLKEPYRGMVQLQSSEVGEDLAWYLTTSEQVPSMIALGVRLDRDANVAAAGGILVQALPGADPHLLALLEERLQHFPPVSTLLFQGGTPQSLLAQLFVDIPFSEQARVQLAFRCSCSRRQAEQILASLGREELLALAAREEETFVTCEYCREVYGFTGAALSALVAAG